MPMTNIDIYKEKRYNYGKDGIQNEFKKIHKRNYYVKSKIRIHQRKGYPIIMKKNILKKRLEQITALLLSICMLSACAMSKPTDEDNTQGSQNASTSETTQNGSTQSETDKTAPQDTPDSDAPSGAADMDGASFAIDRPALIEEFPTSSETAVTPSIEAYTVAPDLSNVTNLQQFYLPEQLTALLAKNGFAVREAYSREFFEIYENNRYALIPNFVTVDSLMHTYHLYFTHLLKNIEKNHLSDTLKQLSIQMMEKSAAQYEVLKGSEWENAAIRNVAFFTIGAKLLDDSVTPYAYVQDIVTGELDKINATGGIAFSAITGDEEDYTQYVPRGYYAGDDQLEQYFKAMMWYGRIHFIQEEADLDRSALLMTAALSADPNAFGLWESIYAVTSFFAGASDDAGVCEYASIMQEVYGNDVSVSDFPSQESLFHEFHEKTSSLPSPQINSIPIQDGENNIIPGFRFMGQRFSIDATIMQALIYSRVSKNSSGTIRMLPDVLDVPATLGSETAYRILEEAGATDYAGYTDNMADLRQKLTPENTGLCSASLYAGWLHTLRPLLSQKGEGYPMFMQSEEWAKKDLECFAGSFTELKHDTVLYSKQVIAEMGGDYWEESDARGYVQPEPLIYERFMHLASQTAKGLESLGMLDADDKENLLRLTQIAEQLLAISNKELMDEVLTDAEYEFIECYGGTIEHFWYDVMSKEGMSESITTQEYPSALVVDIATDPNGTILEAATGTPSQIFVIVKVDGKLKIATGSVYSFYQFPWPMEDRMTDQKWRQMMGIAPDEEGVFHDNASISQPDWTQSYRCQ